jgi:hypothetical protein
MITLKEMIAAKGLKDPSGKAKPMRVTLAMVQAAGKYRKYPFGYEPSVDGYRETVGEDGEIRIDFYDEGKPSIIPDVQGYVAEFCKRNHLKATS